MKILGNIFVNADERRLRAFWRIALVCGLGVAGELFLQALFGIILGLISVFSGAKITQSVDIQVAIVSNPYLPALSAAVTLLATWLAFLLARRVDKRSLVAYGFRFNRVWWRDFAFGLVLGALLMALIFAIELSAGWLTISGVMLPVKSGQPLWLGLLLELILFLSVGFYEEMISRGYLLRNFAEGLHGKLINPRAALLAAYVLSSMIFGVLHAGNPNSTLVSSVFLMAAGLFLGLGYILTGSLAIPIGLHITWNFFQGCVFGFPVSGLGIGTSLITIQQAGPDLITGGAFGPEAGLIGLAAIAVGSILIALWLRRSRGGVQLSQNLATYSVDQVNEV